MSSIVLNEPGKEVLLMGNEAIARGALEAGVKVCAAYPGTPSSEITESLAKVSKERNIYVEWSTNEKVALEVAVSASFSGLRAICAMKMNGLNVASDFLLNLNYIGVQGGLVLVTSDDPTAHSSTTEQDTRMFSKMADLPLLEPSTFHEAKEMTKWAFEISEEIGNVCMIRGVTRISHARGNVTLGTLPQDRNDRKPYFDTKKQRNTHPTHQKHNQLHKNLDHLENVFSTCPFNQYKGPHHPKVLIITCGSGWLYSQDAVELMGLEDSIGILKISTTWPLPSKIIVEHLKDSDLVLFIEEVEPFLEGNVKEIAADFSLQIGAKTFFGKKSGHIEPFGEMNTNRIIDALSNILNLSQVTDPEYEDKAKEIANNVLTFRVRGLCPGCPHRASLWAIKNALALDNRDGFVTGDIGCYGQARSASGFYLAKTGGAMGTGTGLASGFGRLSTFGFDQPVISLCGDSTFFHAAMPALANGIHNKANMIMVILDNSTTAMTGFQPHPGMGVNAMGKEADAIDIENVCRAFGAKVEVMDPFELEHTKQKVLQALEDPVGVKVLIMRRECTLFKLREERPPYRMHVDLTKCIGEDCGCNRLCTRVFKCPGLIWDKELGKAKIDEVMCTGCGVCEQICPQKAIVKEEAKQSESKSRGL